MIKDKETRETIEKLKKLASDSFQEIKGTLKLVQEKQANLEGYQKSMSSSVTLADPGSQDKIKEIEGTIATMKSDFQNAIDTVRVQLEDAASVGKPRNVSIDDVPAEDKKKFLYRILEGLSDESFIELAETIGKGALLADSSPLDPAALGDGQPTEASGAAAVATAEKPEPDEAALGDTGLEIYFDKKPEDGREYQHLDYINAWVPVK